MRLDYSYARKYRKARPSRTRKLSKYFCGTFFFLSSGPGGLLAERTHGDGIEGVPASLRHTRPATRGAFYTWWLRLMMACKRYVYAYTYVPWEICTSICTFRTCVFVCSICNSILNIVSLSPLSLMHTPMHTLQGDSSFSVYTAPCTFHVRRGMNGGPTYCAKVCMQKCTHI